MSEQKKGRGRPMMYPAAFLAKGLEPPEWAFEKEREREKKALAAKEEIKARRLEDKEKQRRERIKLTKELKTKKNELLNQGGADPIIEEEIKIIKGQIKETKVEPPVEYPDLALFSVPPHKYIPRDYYKKYPEGKASKSSKSNKSSKSSKASKSSESKYKVKSKNGKIMYFYNGKLISKKRFLSLK